MHNVYKYVIVLYHNFIVHLIVTAPLFFFIPLHRINGGTIQQKQFMKIIDIDETFNWWCLKIAMCSNEYFEKLNFSNLCQNFLSKINFRFRLEFVYQGYCMAWRWCIVLSYVFFLDLILFVCVYYKYKVTKLKL